MPEIGERRFLILLVVVSLASWFVGFMRVNPVLMSGAIISFGVNASLLVGDIARSVDGPRRETPVQDKEGRDAKE
jgi:hypothetical protein